MFFLEFLLFLFKGLLILTIIMQYGIVLKMFFKGEWDTRKEFLLHLIPCYPHVYLTRDIFKEAKAVIRSSWNKLK